MIIDELIRRTISIPDSRVAWRVWESEDMERGGGGAEGRKKGDGEREEGMQGN